MKKLLLPAFGWADAGGGVVVTVEGNPDKGLLLTPKDLLPMPSIFGILGDTKLLCWPNPALAKGLLASVVGMFKGKAEVGAELFAKNEEEGGPVVEVGVGKEVEGALFVDPIKKEFGTGLEPGFEFAKGLRGAGSGLELKVPVLSPVTKGFEVLTGSILGLVLMA